MWNNSLGIMDNKHIFTLSKSCEDCFHLKKRDSTFRTACLGEHVCSYNVVHCEWLFWQGCSWLLRGFLGGVCEVCEVSECDCALMCVCVCLVKQTTPHPLYPQHFCWEECVVCLLRWMAVPTFLTNIRRERREKRKGGERERDSENVGLEWCGGPILIKRSRADTMYRDCKRKRGGLRKRGNHCSLNCP